MNRLVREHYPAAKLPDDLKEGLDAGDEVRVTVEVLRASDIAAAGHGKNGLFSQFRHLAFPRFASMEEIDRHVQTIRDEWDARDR